jgi:hypothetical protein
VEEKRFKKVFVDFGSGRDYVRAREMAEKHPDWLVFAVDPNIVKRDTGLKNLVAITKHAGKDLSLEFEGRKFRADEVEMNYISTVPFYSWDKAKEGGRKTYAEDWDWIVEKDIAWLKPKAAIKIRVFPDMVEDTVGLDNCNKIIRDAVRPYGYRVSSKTEPVRRPWKFFTNPERDAVTRQRIPFKPVTAQTEYDKWAVVAGKRITFTLRRGELPAAMTRRRMR